MIFCPIEKATPAEQVNDSSQPLPIPNTPHSNVGTRSPAASLGTSPCQSPMLREEDELSGTWESEGEDEDAGPDPHGMESDTNLTEVDMSDMDMNKVEPDRVVGFLPNTPATAWKTFR